MIYTSYTVKRIIEQSLVLDHKQFNSIQICVVSDSVINHIRKVDHALCGHNMSACVFAACYSGFNRILITWKDYNVWKVHVVTISLL